MIKPYTIFVRWQGDTDYHKTNWASDNLIDTRRVVKECMAKIEGSVIGRHGKYKGLPRFTGIKILENDVEIYKEERS